MLCLAVLLSAWGCGDRRSGSDGEQVKIGVVIPLSGELAGVGKKIREGYEIAEADINREGGIDGKDVKFVYADHRSDPDTGAQEAERLVQDDGVVALTGCYDSAVTLTVAQVAERRRVPLIVPYSAANAITEQGYQYTFRTRPPTRVWTKTIYDFFGRLDQLAGIPVDRIGFFGEDNEISAGQIDDLKAVQGNGGPSVAEPVLYRAGTRDLVSLLNRLKTADVQAIYGNSYLPETIAALRSMKAIGLRVPYVTIGTTLVHPDFLTQAGRLAENATGTAAWAPDISPESESFAKAFRDRFKGEPTDDSAYAYSAAYILKEAIETAGTSESARIAEVLREHEFTSKKANIIPTKSDSIKFDEKGQAEAQVLFRQVQDGKFVTVYPSEFAKGKLATGQWFVASN